MSAEILVSRLGLISYEEAWEAQQSIATARQRDELPDVLLLLEHQPVYTRGRRSTSEELPMGVEWYEMQGIEVRETDRGGRVTYHGPGQLVAYPIVSLRPYGDDVHAYVRRLEQVAISSLAEHGVRARTIDGLTGMWTEGRRPGSPEEAAGLGSSSREAPGVVADAEADARKIGSIGVHVSRGVTTHGLAVNVNNDLQPFEWVVPCGIEGARATSVARELGAEQDLDRFTDTVARRFGELFGRTLTDIDSSELLARAGDADEIARHVASASEAGQYGRAR